MQHKCNIHWSAITYMIYDVKTRLSKIVQIVFTKKSSGFQRSVIVAKGLATAYSLTNPNHHFVNELVIYITRV